MESLIVSLDGRIELLDNVLRDFVRITENSNPELFIGKINLQRFSDGELCVDFKDSVRGKRVYLLTSPKTSDDIMILLLAIDAAKRASAQEIIPILPYYPYSRQDKKDQSRGPIGAKVIAKLIETSGASSIITYDLHADQIQGFYEIPTTHISGKNVFDKFIVSIANENTILAGPDAGSGKRLKRIRDHINKHYGLLLNYVMIDKVRVKANEIESMVLIGDVTGKDVIIIDDMIDTGGTLCKAAEHLLDNGANSVRAVISHGVLSGKAYENINNSKLLELVISDSIETKTNDRIRVISVSEQIAKAILAHNNNLSYDNIKTNL